MDINQAIEHVNSVIKNCPEYGCRADHEQLLEWLVDYKRCQLRADLVEWLDGHANLLIAEVKRFGTCGVGFATVEMAADNLKQALAALKEG